MKLSCSNIGLTYFLLSMGFPLILNHFDFFHTFTFKINKIFPVLDNLSEPRPFPLFLELLNPLPDIFRFFITVGAVSVSIIIVTLVKNVIFIYIKMAVVQCH